MKIFGFCLAVALIAHFTPMKADNQEKHSSIDKTERKIYVPSNDLSFGDDGIFWQINQGTWVRVSGVDCDSQGIYLTGSRVISRMYAICRSCKTRYTQPYPSKCEVCGNTSFDYEYEDIWDRRAQ